MVTIMTLLIVCAVFAILGGLAFTEVRALQFKLQEKQRQYDDAITALDVYRSRNNMWHERASKFELELTTLKGKFEIETKMCKHYSKRWAEAMANRDGIQHKCNMLETLYQNRNEECRQLRSLFNEHELLKQKHDELVAKHQLIIDSLPDWAGGEVIDDEDED
jgi:hypothetical protein